MRASVVLEVGDERLARSRSTWAGPLAVIPSTAARGGKSFERDSYVFVAATHDYFAPSLQDKYRNETPGRETAMLDKIGKRRRGSRERGGSRTGMGHGVADTLADNRHTAERTARC